MATTAGVRVSPIVNGTLAVTDLEPMGMAHPGNGKP